jgi:hypothetical protein
MKSLNRNQAIWLARGSALGAFLLGLLRLLCAGAGQLRDIGRAHRGLPKRL